MTIAGSSLEWSFFLLVFVTCLWEFFWGFSFHFMSSWILIFSLTDQWFWVTPFFQISGLVPHIISLCPRLSHRLQIWYLYEQNGTKCKSFKIQHSATVLRGEEIFCAIVALELRLTWLCSPEFCWFMLVSHLMFKLMHSLIISYNVIYNLLWAFRNRK